MKKLYAAFLVLLIILFLVGFLVGFVERWC